VLLFPDNMKIKKTLIITKNCFPPVIVGPAILLGNLFRRFEGNYCVLMGNLEDEFRSIDNSFWFPCEYYYTVFPKQNNGWQRFRSILKDLTLVLKSTMKGLKVVKQEKIKNILLVPSYLESLAALLIHWITGKRLIVYLFDIYYVSNRFGPGWSSLFMRLIEPVMLRFADIVLVTAEPTQDYYKKKYNIDSVVLPHSVELEEYNNLSDCKLKKSKETAIIFTGEVSEAQLDSILNMVNTVSNFPELNARFIIAANASRAIIESLGIQGSSVSITNVNRDEIPALQKSADILFLPLSFTWQSPEIIKTAVPSKMPEYLAAGRPILVHAPEYSYVAQYARSEHFAAVVDEPDCNELGKVISDLICDEKLCRTLVENARKTVKKHDSIIVSEKLQSILQYD